MHQRSIANVHLLFVRTEGRKSARIERKLLEDLIDDVVRYWDNGIRITVDDVEFHSAAFAALYALEIALISARQAKIGSATDAVTMNCLS